MNADSPLEKNSLEEAYRLQILARYGILDVPADPALTRIAQAAAALSDSSVGLLSMVDKDQLVFMAGADDLPCKSLPRKSSLCDVAIRTNNRFEVADVKHDKRFEVYSLPEHPMSGSVASYAGVPLRSPEGPVMGMLCVIGDHVRELQSKQWDALELLADATMSVLDARAETMRSLTSIGVMIDTLDSEFLLINSHDMRVLYGNAGVASRVACGVRDLPGKHLRDIYPEEACQQVMQAYSDLSSALIKSTGFECRLTRADGSLCHSKGTIQLRGWQSGHAIVILTTDTTELARERVSREAAEAANLAKSKFLTSVSHEIRTSLNSVLGFSQLLLGNTDEQLSERQRTQVNTIRESGWHLLALINDVLDISRIESGRLSVHADSVSIAGLLNKLIALVQVQATASQVDIELLNADQDGVCVWGDPLRLHQVLLNLMTNAVKYNRPGGQVRIAFAVVQTGVQICIEDTGLGMTAEQQAHLFEPFNRLGRENGNIEGTGIGLALAKQLIELMNGQVQVSSKAGQGTTVSITLPQAKTQPQAPATSTIPSELTAAIDEEPSGVVLYIEDNMVNTLIVEQFMSRWPKVRLLTAECGERGLELARKYQPDVILLDMNLPDFLGVQLLERLASDPLTAASRTVVVSASAVPEDIRQAKNAGASDYWTKPLNLEHFELNLRRILNHAEPATLGHPRPDL